MKSNAKKLLRREMIIKRKNMKEEHVEDYSSRIRSKLLSLPEFKSSKNIMLYLSFKNEVDTYRIVDWCLENDKNVIVPYCINEERKMIPCQLKDIEKELVKNPLGFMEPSIDCIKKVDMKDIDLVIVPGVAFDISGNRLGFGGGYYDRFLKKIYDTPNIALCYEYQLVDEVPIGKFDVPLNCIITEEKIVRIN